MVPLHDHEEAAMSTDVNLSPTPLALRIPPVEGEAWPAYLDRTAREYRCHPALLVEPISTRWAKRLRHDLSTCTSGIAMTDPVAQATARRLNLDPAEVQAMQLSTHDGATLTLDDEDISRFDPVTGSATTNDLHSLGWIAGPRSLRWCRNCDLEQRNVDLLIWRYPWVTVCIRHETLLHPHNLEVNQAVSWECWEDLFDTQEDLEEVLAGRRPFTRLSTRDGFVELLATSELLARRRGAATFTPTGLWQPAFMAEVLPRAFTAIEAPIDHWATDLYEDLTRGKHHGAALSYLLQRHGATSPFGLRSDLTRFVADPGHVLNLLARDIRIPREQQPLTTATTRATAWAALPHLMPKDLTVPTLTDFTPWLSTRGAQIAAAQVALMLTTGGSLKEVCDHHSVGGPSQVPLRRLWWHLESLGQLEQYFEAVALAAHTLLHSHHTHQPVDAPISQRPSHPSQQIS